MRVTRIFVVNAMKEVKKTSMYAVMMMMANINGNFETVHL